jgi:hypothetical protein
MQQDDGEFMEKLNIKTDNFFTKNVQQEEDKIDYASISDNPLN